MNTENTEQKLMDEAISLIMGMSQEKLEAVLVEIAKELKKDETH